MMQPNRPHDASRNFAKGILRKCVLVADDEPAVRSVIAKLLQHYGIEVFNAANGHQAIEIFSRRFAQIDLVLLDIRMENLDGPATLQSLRQIDPDVRCCFMTGDSGDYSDDELLSFGALRVLRKPFILAAVLEIVSGIRPRVLSTVDSDGSTTL